MKNFKAFLILLTSTIVLFSTFLIWHRNTFTLAKVESYNVNLSKSDQKILIATTAGNFPESICQGLVERYKNNFHINVIDISSLQEIRTDNYEGIIIIHTWEKWNPPPDVSAFIERSDKHKGKLVVLATSSGGSSQTDDVDGITGEQESENTQFYVEKVSGEMNYILEPKQM